MKKKPKYTAKTVNLAPTVEELDALWNKCVKTRDGFKCVYSKEVLGHHVDTILQAHHILEKPNQRLRWELSNGITITKGVHFGVAHSNSVIRRLQFLQWALDRLPKKKRQELLRLDKVKTVGGVNKFLVKIYLEKKLKEFESKWKTTKNCS